MTEAGEQLLAELRRRDDENIRLDWDGMLSAAIPAIEAEAAKAERAWIIKEWRTIEREAPTIAIRNRRAATLLRDLVDPA